MDHLSRPWFSVSDSHTLRVEPLSQNLEGATFSLGPLWYTLLSFQSFSQKFEVLATLFAHKLYFAQNGAPRGKRGKKKQLLEEWLRSREENSGLSPLSTGALLQVLNILMAHQEMGGKTGSSLLRRPSSPLPTTFCLPVFHSCITHTSRCSN